ncbi:FliM/FliN family flagellar motor switch protein [uncultured Kiloniella sp.]|uniref:FliM/FliN family flagellar motor switch protein n=1 Tax=uncultured Kiloniella sp. TaxID=1133091 RepID=UPI00262E7DA8|nr:FliM/FliN family flagellar motor switch protein [uncultured Kiloniella sp.]
MSDEEAMNNDDVDDMFDSPPEEADSPAAALPVNDENVPAVHGVGLEVSAILGTAQMPVSQLLKMGRGAVVELDKYIGDTIDISINDQMIARGEVMIKEDRLCVEIIEMIKRTGD